MTRPTDQGCKSPRFREPRYPNSSPASMQRHRMVEDGVVGIEEICVFLVVVVLRQELPELLAHAFRRRAAQQSHPTIALVEDFERVEIGRAHV